MNLSLWHGNCLELMKHVPDQTVDMILVDPPYGMTKNEWDHVLPFDQLWTHYNRVIKDHGAILIFSQMPFSAYVVVSNPSMFRYEWIWQKSKATNFMNAKKMPLKAHENILVFYKKIPTYNPQGIISGVSFKTGRSRKGDSRNYGKTGCSNPNYVQTICNYPRDILSFANPSNVGHLHPTEKPVQLLEYLIRTYTQPGETVLDNCMGSGSTAIACINCERSFIGMEVESQYFKIAVDRITKHQHYQEEQITLF